jgi:hypothetical protein
MTARKQKTRPSRKAASSRKRNGSKSEARAVDAHSSPFEKLIPAELGEVERQTHEAGDREPRFRDASSGGRYFLNQADRLRNLAGVLVTLMEDFYDQTEDLRGELKEIEPLVMRGLQIRRGRCCFLKRAGLAQFPIKLKAPPCCSLTEQGAWFCFVQTNDCSALKAPNEKLTRIWTIIQTNEKRQSLVPWLLS